MKTALLTLALCSSLLPALALTPVHTELSRSEQAMNEYDRQLKEELFIRAPLPAPRLMSEAEPPTIQPATIKPEYIQPAQGVLTSGYGMRWGRMHKGIDIAAAVGTPIIAAADGQVIGSGWNSGGYGLLVEISHANGSITRYAHNSKALVSVGQSVSQGQAIALMGSTGNSTGSHCHFEIILPGKGAVNPIAFLPQK